VFADSLFRILLPGGLVIGRCRPVKRAVGTEASPDHPQYRRRILDPARLRPFQLAAGPMAVTPEKCIEVLAPPRSRPPQCSKVGA
jgi:hypothetical protein